MIITNIENPDYDIELEMKKIKEKLNDINNVDNMKENKFVIHNVDEKYYKEVIHEQEQIVKKNLNQATKTRIKKMILNDFWYADVRFLNSEEFLTIKISFDIPIKDEIEQGREYIFNKITSEMTFTSIDNKFKKQVFSMNEIGELQIIYNNLKDKKNWEV